MIQPTTNWSGKTVAEARLSLNQPFDLPGRVREPIQQFLIISGRIPARPSSRNENATEAASS